MAIFQWNTRASCMTYSVAKLHFFFAKSKFANIWDFFWGIILIYFTAVKSFESKDYFCLQVRRYLQWAGQTTYSQVFIFLYIWSFMRICMQLWRLWIIQRLYVMFYDTPLSFWLLTQKYNFAQVILRYRKYFYFWYFFYSFFTLRNHI